MGEAKMEPVFVEAAYAIGIIADMQRTTMQKDADPDRSRAFFGLNRFPSKRRLCWLLRLMWWFAMLKTIVKIDLASIS
jgi:hypothetical protein